ITPDGESAEPLQLEAVNLSRGGLFVKSEQSLPEGTRVSLELAAAGRLLDFAEGEVAWIDNDGFGVRFTYLRPPAAGVVDHLVARGGRGQWVKIDPPKRGRRRPAVVLGVLLCVAGGAAWQHGRKPPKIEVAAAPHPAPPASMSLPPAVDLTAQAFPG